MLTADFKMDGGLNVDARAIDVPPNTWTGASNINFVVQTAQGTAARVAGHAATWVTPAAAAPTFALNMDVLGAASRSPTNYKWYGGTVYGGVNARIGQQTGGVDSNVTPGAWAAAAPGRWTGGILNNFVPVLNDQTHVPVYWDILGPAWQVLPGWPPSGAALDSLTALRPYREFLIGMGRLIPAGSYRSDVVYWSDAAPYNAPPATWVPAATNQAGEAVLPGGGEIIDGAALGEDFLVYKRYGSYRMSYVGGNYVMSVEPMFKGWGAFSQNCIAEHGGKHYVFTGDDIIVTDGQRWESALYAKARSQISAGTNGLNTHLYVNRLNRELWLNLVAVGGSVATTALVMDLDSGKTGIRQLPNVSGMVHEDQGTDVSPISIYAGDGGAASGRFYNHFSGTTFAGTNITASLTRAHLDFGRPDQLKIVKWVRPWIMGGPGVVTVEVAGTATIDDSVTYGTAVNFDTASSDKADLFAQGRYLSFRFGSSADMQRWTCSGFTVGYELRGGY